jgi:DNA-directed RNA polymerase sigma subunit (sigma70/sigma32)
MVLDRYFRCEDTMEEIAKLEGVSRERIRQIMVRGIRKMRHYITREELPLPTKYRITRI